MPRGPRVILPEIAVHIVQRGHNRMDCFLHDTDYLVYLASLRELAARTGCALHAYCLMTNHTHLLLTPSNPKACGRLMRNLGQRYVQYFNRRYQRSGTLWEGRFKSCLVDSASYVIAAHRYIERNPVRAGMVQSASAYPWSSHNGNAGRSRNNILTSHAEYLALGIDETSRHAAYQRLFENDDDPAFLAEIRDATNGGFALMDERVRSQLPGDIQPRLKRRRSGPKAAIRGRNQVMAELELELGLRPRRG